MKIIQILVAPDNYTWQNHLLGLGDDGKVYIEQNGKWENYEVVYPNNEEPINVK